MIVITGGTGYAEACPVHKSFNDTGIVEAQKADNPQVSQSGVFAPISL